VNRARTISAAALVLALGVSLSACTSTPELPDGPTQEQIDAALATELDTQWEVSGLEGVFDRPEIIPERIVGANQWGTGLAECLSSSGIDSWGYDPRSGFTNGEGEGTDVEKLIYYSCFAKYPSIDVLSPDQLDFIYDYFAHWLIPCLGMRGYAVEDIPSRRAFIETPPEYFGRWNPYNTISSFPQSVEAQTRLIEECPSTVPGIEGWSEITEDAAEEGTEADWTSPD
jgi:hypothetical protein